MFGGLLRLLVVLPVASQLAAVVVVVRVLRVGDVRARGGVQRHHDGQVRHGRRPVVRRGVRALGLGVLRAAALHLVLDVLALVADGHAAAGVGRDVGARAQDGPRGREVGGVLQALGARPQRGGRRLVDARQRVAPHGPVHLAVAQLGPLDLAVGVVRLVGGGQGGRVVGRGGVARGCLRGGGVGEVCRHEVPHLVTCSVVVGAVLRPVVVGARVRLGRRVARVSILLLLGVHCQANKKTLDIWSTISENTAALEHLFKLKRYLKVLLLILDLIWI